ncbi:MAG: hypothetical protein IH585_14135 [Anaerolineaceae bacterium]|nr:hypothetical protein [Anaerolineaceae bacterium]
MRRRHLIAVIVLMMGFLSACIAPTAEPTALPPTETTTITPTVTVTIDWFPATSTPTPRPTQVKEPTPEMRPGVGSLLVDDLLSSGSQWQTGRFSAGNITLVNDSLTIAIQQPKASLLSLEMKNMLRDFYLETKVNIGLCKSNDVYGLVVRAISEYNYYRFLVDCQGYARAERVRDGATTLMQGWTPTGLPPGAPLDVSLGVWAVGSEMRLFANNAFIFSVKDPVFTEGTVGIFARADGDSPVTVSFSEMTVSSVENSQ